jgi:hypothetical protein
MDARRIEHTRMAKTPVAPEVSLFMFFFRGFLSFLQFA